MKRCGGLLKKSLAMILWAMFFSVNVWAADYYVAVGGNNANDGSVSAPWQTITYALVQAQKGDIIHASAGAYSSIING